MCPLRLFYFIYVVYEFLFYFIPHISVILGMNNTEIPCFSQELLELCRQLRDEFAISNEFRKYRHENPDNYIRKHYFITMALPGNRPDTRRNDASVPESGDTFCPDPVEYFTLGPVERPARAPGARSRSLGKTRPAPTGRVKLSQKKPYPAPESRRRRPLRPI